MDDAKLLEQLRQLQSAPGPFVSLYLNTEAARELGPDEIELRWRNLRDGLGEAVPEKALLLVDEIVEGSHRKGNGLAAFTSGEEVLFRRFLTSPIADEGRAGALPHLVPLLEWMQDHPHYAVVVIDRVGADIHVVGGLTDDVTIEIAGDHDELRKVNPGGWSQRRFQNRAEDSWEQNASEVAGALDRIVEAEGCELVVVMGDVRAESFLKEHVGPHTRPLLHLLDTAPPTADELEAVREEVEASVTAITARNSEELLSKFLEERGQLDLAADGPEETFEALRMAQVNTLLVSGDVDGTAWFSREQPTQGSLTRAPLEEIGIEDLEEAPMVDVLVRMALATGASVRVVPSTSGERGPSDGVGAILRFTTEPASRS